MLHRGASHGGSGGIRRQYTSCVKHINLVFWLSELRATLLFEAIGPHPCAGCRDTGISHPTAFAVNPHFSLVAENREGSLVCLLALDPRVTLRMRQHETSVHCSALRFESALYRRVGRSSCVVRVLLDCFCREHLFLPLERSTERSCIL